MGCLLSRPVAPPVVVSIEHRSEQSISSIQHNDEWDNDHQPEPAVTSTDPKPIEQSTPVEGHDPSMFIDVVSSELICSVCLCVLRDASYLRACKHRFCKSCISDWLKRELELMAPHEVDASLDYADEEGGGGHARPSSASVSHRHEELFAMCPIDRIAVKDPKNDVVIDSPLQDTINGLMCRCPKCPLLYELQHMERHRCVDSVENLCDVLPRNFTKSHCESFQPFLDSNPTDSDSSIGQFFSVLVNHVALNEFVSILIASIGIDIYRECMTNASSNRWTIEERPRYFHSISQRIMSNSDLLNRFKLVSGLILAAVSNRMQQHQ